MEIERKFLVSGLPDGLDQFYHYEIEQGYLCTEPVVRIRRQGDAYFLTYKSKGFLVREEYNLPLTREAYEHMRPKADGLIISKTRYVLPIESELKIELDIFHAPYETLRLAEVEFPDEDTARQFIPPAWFGEDVTFSEAYQNSTLSKGFFQNPHN
ncbi:CYTH domain-containing protein [Novisyntrophococcus fermenticellae]|uniref:CYTH domain-containing protein n=1 Tax=Novisyntrophococcus fermenticellae TaxID=2068655 RepID=UPI001E2EF7D7|nr:CYTH domain-containing protein [Novisyntrophococcus fermenticellae]